MPQPLDLQLSLDTYGALVATLPGREPSVGVEVVRCFPYSDPERMIALVDAAGKELATIDDLAQLTPVCRDVLLGELRQRDFMPVITRICSASPPAPPSTWSVETDRGPATLRVESEDDVRKIAHGQVIIADSGGLRYRVTNVEALDRFSQRTLRRVL